MQNKKAFLLMLSILIIGGIGYISYFGLNPDEPDYHVKPSKKPFESQNGYGVSASHPLAVKVGMEVLKDGGNAVDAAVAVSYALGVVEPYGSGIGGGGEMLVLMDGEKPKVYDYREVAPITGKIPSSDVGIPGFVKGMEAAHEELGSMDLEKLLSPSIQLASEGFEADSHLTERLSAASYRMPVQSLPHLYPKGRAIRPKELLKQPELAEALTLIQTGGSEAFYSGDIAKDILKKIQTFNPSDLKNYSVSKADPVYGEFEGFEVISSPPPLSGITLIQSLQMAEVLNLDSTENNLSDFIHLTSEITKRAYDDRLKNIADPGFYNGYDKEIISEDYSEALAKDISVRKLSDDYKVNDSLADQEDHDNTTHFVVVDRDGNMVSATNTLGNFFGSGEYVDGFFLNSQMSNFSMSKNQVNSAAPGKRPRSFTSPTILRKDGLLIGIGTPGGKRIPTVMAQVLVRHLSFNESIQDAIDAPRFYSEGKTIYVEDGFSSEVLDELRDRGYSVEVKDNDSYYGSIQSIIVDKEEGLIYGGADKRRSGLWQASDEDS